MFKYLLHKYIFFYFLIIYLNILYHTVVSASDPVSSHQNGSSSKENKTELAKRGEKNQYHMKTGNQSQNFEDKFVPPANNVTVVNKLLPEDGFNSTAKLPSWVSNIKDGALQRTGYVALGFMSIVVLFFVVRAVRLRHKKSKSRKYGIITSTVSDMEMEPLDKDDDEEEDTTLFDAQHKYSLQ